MILQSTIDIDVRNDGVYLIINNANDDSRIKKQDVLEFIERYQIKDIDFEKVSSIFKSKDLLIETKVSSNTQITQRNEEAIISKSNDNLEAYIKFSKPTNGGKILTVSMIKKQISEAGIKYGVIDGLVESLVLDKKYMFTYLLAVGKKSVDGSDAFLQFNFDKKNKTLKPKVLENGRVDYQNLGLIEMAKKGDVLVFANEPVEGSDGITVCGKEIKHVKGKPASNLPKGNNVYISEDKSKLIASITGQINYVNGKVNMCDIFTVNGNVDNNTGNIDFNGSVVVKGNVCSGFSVIANGNIEVMGSVEGSNIKSKGNIFLGLGVQGSGKAIIEADGDVFCKYVESATMIARGNITSECIIHSKVECFGKLELIGNKAALLGGVTSVRRSIVAKDIGSSMGTITDIKIGNDPENLNKYNEAVKTLQNIKNDYIKMNQIIEILEKTRQIKELSIDKKSQYVKALHTKELLIEQKNQIEKNLVHLISEMKSDEGMMSASNIIYSGVVVLIGNALMHVRDDIYKSKLINKGGIVKVINL